MTTFIQSQCYYNKSCVKSSTWHYVTSTVEKTQNKFVENRKNLVLKIVDTQFIHLTRSLQINIVQQKNNRLEANLHFQKLGVQFQGRQSIFIKSIMPTHTFKNFQIPTNKPISWSHNKLDWRMIWMWSAKYMTASLLLWNMTKIVRYYLWYVSSNTNAHQLRYHINRRHWAGSHLKIDRLLCFHSMANTHIS